MYPGNNVRNFQLHFIFQLLFYFCVFFSYCKSMEISGMYNNKLLSENSETIIRVKQGSLRGSVEANIDGGEYLLFSGIPYAEPPLGELRFKVNFYSKIEIILRSSRNNNINSNYRAKKNSLRVRPMSSRARPSHSGLEKMCVDKLIVRRHFSTDLKFFF